MKNIHSNNTFLQRSTLVIFILLGLVVLEYGCKKEEVIEHKCKDSDMYKITDINSVSMLEQTAFDLQDLEEGDTVKFSDLIMQVNFNQETVMLEPSSSNYGAYALRAFIPVCWNMNSINIVNEIENEDVSGNFTVDKLYNAEPPFDITNDDTFKQQLADQLIEAPAILEFKMKNAPSEIKTYKFQFTFGNTDGTAHRYTTQSITIIP